MRTLFFIFHLHSHCLVSEFVNAACDLAHLIVSEAIVNTMLTNWSGFGSLADVKTAFALLHRAINDEIELAMLFRL